MKILFYILPYIVLTNAFNNIITTPNTMRLINNINFKMQNNNIDTKKIDKIDSGKLVQNELNTYYGYNEIMKFGYLNNDKLCIENDLNLYVRNAIILGFLNKNSILADEKTSIIAGNKGFDPLNCSIDISTLKKYREVEIKHGRLGMFTTIGRPISVLFHPYLSKITQNTNILSFNNKVPSILNGALEKINPIFLMSIIILFFMRIGTRM